MDIELDVDIDSAGKDNIDGSTGQSVDLDQAVVDCDLDADNQRLNNFSGAVLLLDVVYEADQHANSGMQTEQDTHGTR